MYVGMPTLIELATFEQNVALCKELGLDFIELNMNLPQYQPANIDREQIRAARENGVFTTLHIDERMDLADFNPRVAQAYLDTAMEAIDTALELEMPLMNMHTNKGVYFTLPDQKVFLYKRFTEHYTKAYLRFRDMAQQRIGTAGLKLCVENTDGYATFEKDMILLLLQSPAFGLTLDIGHSQAVDNVDLPFITEHKDRLRHMHMHDCLGKSNHLALGDGQIDLDARFALAKEAGASIVLETKTVEGLRRSAQVFKARYQ